jgi:excinuclease ABC subunit C
MRRGYICVGRQPAPQVFLALKPPRTAFAVFGPVPTTGKAREAVRRVNDWFRLRDCPKPQTMIFADQRELFPLPLAPGCLRHEIGNCLAPCAAACSRIEYSNNLAAAQAFLDGKDTSPLDHLERDMAAAAAAMQFEHAAAVRDKLDVLRWLVEHLDRLRQAAQHSFIYPVRGYDHTERWYLIDRGRVCAVFPGPANAAERQELVGRVAEIYRQARSVSGPLTLDEIDGVLLVTSWFRRQGGERERTMPLESLLT